MQARRRHSFAVARGGRSCRFSGGIDRALGVLAIHASGLGRFVHHATARRESFARQGIAVQRGGEGTRFHVARERAGAGRVQPGDRSDVGRGHAVAVSRSGGCGIRRRSAVAGSAARWDAPAHPLCAACLAIFYIFDLKGVAFTANGMETAFLLFFLAAAIALWVRGDTDPWLAAEFAGRASCGRRPDAIVYIGALVAGDLFFAPLDRRRCSCRLPKVPCWADSCMRRGSVGHRGITGRPCHRP